MSPVIKKSYKEKKESAVSPVVGVMLMLVVTIIIAAVVSAFAGGLATDQEAAPSVVLQASVDHEWYIDSYTVGNGTVYLKSVSGQSIDLSRVTVKVTNSTGFVANYTDPSHALFGKQPKLDSGETLNIAYAVNTVDGKYQGLSSRGATINAGETVRVVVTYDDAHVLFNKEVVAV